MKSAKANVISGPFDGAFIPTSLQGEYLMLTTYKAGPADSEKIYASHVYFKLGSVWMHQPEATRQASEQISLASVAPQRKERE